MGEYVLQTQNLTKVFQKVVAVSKVNMHVKKGDIYGFIGRNGAGKTTLMRMIAGLASPTDGKLKLFGEDTLAWQRKRVGFSIESPAFYTNMTVKENLKVYQKLLGIANKNVVEEILHLIDLEQVQNKKAKHLSLGMKQRLQLGITLMGNPDFLVLDEPTNGLDPEGITQVRDLLLKLNKEKQITVLLSSHILGELSKIATCYGIIKQGVLVEEISKEELLTKCRRCLKLQVNDTKKASVILENHCHTKQYDILDANTIRIFDFLKQPEGINRKLVENGIEVKSLQETGQDLEEYFMELMGGKEE